MTLESKYFINFTQSGKRLRLHVFDRSNSFLFNNATNIYQFKAKDSETKDYTLCLSDVSKDFTINDMKKIDQKVSVKLFSVEFDPIDFNDILDTIYI